MMNHETPINEMTGDSTTTNTHEGQVHAPTATCRAALPEHATANNDTAADDSSTTITRNAAGRVHKAFKERDAEKAKVFSGVLSRVGLFAGVGVVIAALGLASERFEVFDAELGIKWYVLGLGYCFVGTGIMLMSTLPPGTFDFDLAFDDRRIARRVVTIGLFLLTAMQSTGFPHVSGLGALGFLTKLIWDEVVTGWCQCCTKDRQKTGGGAPTFLPTVFRNLDNQDRRVHNPADAGCCVRLRPRLSDTICLCYCAVYGFHFGLTYAFVGLCHAAAPPATATNASTFSDVDMLSSAVNITNATLVVCNADSFR